MAEKRGGKGYRGSKPGRDWGPEDEQAAAEGTSIAKGNVRRVRATWRNSSFEQERQKRLKRQEIIDGKESKKA